MTSSGLLDSEFRAALIGALTAFLLGAFAHWRGSARQKRSAGNLALVTLGQMYTEMETLRYHVLDEEPKRLARLMGREPFTTEIRPIMGLSDLTPRLQPDQLGFLSESSDADILNRLLVVERAFDSMIGLVRRHAELALRMQEQMSEVRPPGPQNFHIEQLPDLVGVFLVLQIDDTMTGLIEGLPATRDAILSVSTQLRDVLRMYLPAARFVRFEPLPERKDLGQLAAVSSQAALWRRLTRFVVDAMVKDRHLRPRARQPEPGPAPAPDRPPRIRPFPRPSLPNRPSGPRGGA